MYDVVVVGAGPAGCRIAELASKRGLTTALVDKKKDIGKPVQCTGLVSHRLKSIITNMPDNIVLNKVNRAKFFYPSGNFELESKKLFFVIDREKLDKFLFLRARQAGVDTSISTFFEDFESVKAANIRADKMLDKEDSLILKTSEGKMQTRILVGADGPISTVASKASLIRPSNILTGVQVTVDGNFDPNSVELHFDSNITPDLFGWVVPLSEKRARIGVAAKKNALNGLNTMLKKKLHEGYVKPDVAGRINFGLMKRTSAERIMLIGDAACQVKPFSGGGVIYGLLGAGYCANTCIKAVNKEDFSSRFFKQEYDNKWKSHLGGPIKRGMLFRRLLSGSNTKMNLLLGVAKYFKFILEGFDVDLL